MAIGELGMIRDPPQVTHEEQGGNESAGALALDLSLAPLDVYSRAPLRKGPPHRFPLVMIGLLRRWVGRQREQVRITPVSIFCPCCCPHVNRVWNHPRPRRRRWSPVNERSMYFPAPCNGYGRRRRVRNPPPRSSADTATESGDVSRDDATSTVSAAPIGHFSDARRPGRRDSQENGRQIHVLAISIIRDFCFQ